ncbi:MAG: type II secretion system protein GspL [Steroidobacteraceae bacterium]
MAEILLVRANADGQNASWLVCSAAGELLRPPQQGPLALAATLAAGRRVVGLLPAATVVSLEAELPARAGARLAQAVPYALEEQLAEDIETLHFALGARDASGRTPVAVIARDALEAWLARFTAAGLAPAALHSEAALIAGRPGNLIAVLDEADVHACAPDGRAVTLPAAPLAEALELAAGGVAPEVLGLQVYATPQDWNACSAAVEALRPRFASLHVQLLQRACCRGSPSSSRAARRSTCCRAYAPRGAGTGDWRRWRIAAALGAGLLLLHGGARIWELRQLGRQEAALDAALIEAARPLLGGESRSADLRREIDRRLIAVRSAGSGGGDFLPALAALAQARASVPTAQLERISYESGALDVQLRASDAAAVERVNAALRGGGWQAQLQGGSAVGEQYQGRIHIVSGAAGSGS